jgi:hypothetical protein
MEELEVIDGEPVLEPLPQLAPTEKQCMARKRQGRGYCSLSGYNKQPFTRCKHHGGMSPSGPASPHWKHGGRSKSKFLPEKIKARVEDFTGDVIDNLEESVLIQQALETVIHEQLKTGESSANWSELRQIATETKIRINDLHLKIKFGDDEEIPDGYIDAQTAILKGDAFDAMTEVISEGHKRYNVQVELRKQIQSIHDSQRKLTETIAKARKDIAETYTSEEWHVMINNLNLILKARVTRDVLQLVAQDIQALQPKQLES